MYFFGSQNFKCLFLFVLMATFSARAGSVFSGCRVFNENLEPVGSVQATHCAFNDKGDSLTYHNFSDKLEYRNKSQDLVWTKKLKNLERIDFLRSGKLVLVQSFKIERNEFCKAKVPVLTLYEAKRGKKVASIQTQKALMSLLPRFEGVEGHLDIIMQSEHKDFDCEFFRIDQFLEIGKSEAVKFPKTAKFLVNANSSISFLDKNLKRIPEKIQIGQDLSKPLKILFTKSGQIIALQKSKSDSEGIVLEVLRLRTDFNNPEVLWRRNFAGSNIWGMWLGDLVEVKNGFIFSFSVDKKEQTQQHIDFKGVSIWTKHLGLGPLGATSGDILL